MTGPASAAVEAATGALDPLREACLAAQSAAERARARMHGTDHPLPAVALAAWNSALTLAWRALTDVYEGISDAEQLPSAGPTRATDVLAGLHAACADAERAATLAAQARERLTIAESWLRVVADDPRARAATDRWAVAIAQLDLVAARLAVGARALDAYAEPAATAGGAVRATRRRGLWARVRREIRPAVPERAD